MKRNLFSPLSLSTLRSIFLLIVLAFVFMSSFSLTSASEISDRESFHKSEAIQMFVRENCAHCIAEKKFFSEYQENDSNQKIDIRLVYINANPENLALFQKFSDKYEIFGSPITLAGDRIFQGYNNDDTGNAIVEAYLSSKKQFTFESAIENAENEKGEIFIAGSAPVCTDETIDTEVCSLPKNTVKIPFLGDVSVSSASTQTKYLSSFFLGFLDGFNPCAMWVLTIFLITLMQVGDRVKMLFVAGTFIFAEAIMYGLILVLWWKFFNVFSVQYESIINIIVAVVAILAGLFFVYEGLFSDGTCSVTNLKQQRSISQKISQIAHSPLSWISFFGILMLAFSVNIIEFACSAGYPQIFSKFLLPSFDGDFINQAGLVLTYLGAYMLDDLIVFGIALYSIEKIGITHTYSRIFNMVGGLLMLSLGAIMIFAPALLKGFFG